MDKQNENLKLSNQLCFPLYAVSKEIIRRYKPFLDEIDLTYTQYITMMALWEHQTINVKDLGSLLYLDSGTLTPVLKTLEKKGFVKRTRSSQDERVVIVSITDEGTSIKERASSIPSKMCECLKISKEEMINLHGILHKILSDFNGCN